MLREDLKTHIRDYCSIFTFMTRMAMRARYTFDGVDLAAYMTAAEEWLMSSVGEEALQGGLVPDFTQVENLEVDGDHATATVEGKPIEFVQKDGRWYLLLEL